MAAESSPLQSIDERQLLQAALEHPFEPAEVARSSPSSSSPSSPSPSTPDPGPASPQPTPPASDASAPTQDSDDDWQSSYSAQLSEWRAQNASARSKAELTRAKWEAIRAREEAERLARQQPPESLDNLGAHLTASVTAASETVARSLAGSVTSLSSMEHVEPHKRPEESAEPATQHGKADNGSPSQRWEHITPPSPTSSYPSMSYPEASVPQSPSHQPALLAPTSVPAPTETHLQPGADQNTINMPPSTLPSIMDNRIKPRTRLSLALSSLAINLLLPFINGIMLGFGEIFAKDIVVGWFGWKPRYGSTAAGLGLRR